MSMAMQDLAHVLDGTVYPPTSSCTTDEVHIHSMEEYRRLYEQSIKDPENFWKQIASEQITFFSPFTQVMSGNLEKGDVAWFLNGKLNMCYNAVDRHLPTSSQKNAIIYQGDEPGDVKHITYQELFNDVCRLSNLLKSLGVRKGDAICIYMPMCPEIAIAMLACTRIGAIHSVVFAGFSQDAIRERILDAQCKIVITATQSIRGGKRTPLLETVEKAISDCKCVCKVLVLDQGSIKPDIFKSDRFINLREAMELQRPYCSCEVMDSEDPLFILYTSGSTGRPKGIVHTTAGYATWVSFTHKIIFNLREDDVYACVADVGWITGHSYVVYGPLINGASTLMFQSVPTYPNPSRYWDLVQRHKINIFYSSPTAIRALMRFGEAPLNGYDLSSLRILGTVGEPINPEAWKWYFDNVGKGNCAIVDTYWQTETGGILVSPIPGVTPMKPGCATLPFFGVDLCLRDPVTSAVLHGNNVSGLLTVGKPWPGMARTIHGDHSRFHVTYMQAHPGNYLTGDGAIRDQDGFYWITGRVDDVLNVSGHRIGSAEVESALVSHKSIAEAAVVGRPHHIKGECLFAYVTTIDSVTPTPSLILELQECVRQSVGSFAKPDEILCTPGLPKTRSGKIMRRLLRKIASRVFDPKQFGDTTTLVDPSIVDYLVAEVKKLPPI